MKTELDPKSCITKIQVYVYIQPKTNEVILVVTILSETISKIFAKYSFFFFIVGLTFFRNVET